MNKALLITLQVIFSLFSLNLIAQNDTLAPSFDDLQKMVKKGDVKKLEQSLNTYSIDVNSTPEGKIPLLFYSCGQGKYELTKLLLEKNANPNAVSDYGVPANWAADKGHLEIIDLLLDYGFDPKTEEMDYWVEKFQDGDSIPNVKLSEVIKTVLDSNIDYTNYPFTEYVNSGDPTILTASVIFDKSDSLLLTKRLLSNDVNANLIDRKGFTALQGAVYLLNTDAVELLVKNGASIDQPVYSKHYYEYTSDKLYDNNYTPLHFLLKQVVDNPEYITEKEEEVLKMAQTLIELGADVNAETKLEKQTVLDVAKGIGNKNLIKLLKKAGK